MNLSLKATYGIMAALDLALQNESAPVRAKAIARRQAIPARFLEQVLHAMKRAGLLESLRGARGGYLLTKLPAEVSLAQIVEALDGPLTLSSRGTGPRRGRERARPDTLLGAVWDRVRQAELGVLSGVTLKDLADRYRELEQERALMYHI